MTRTIDDVSYAANRRPENRRIYAEQQVDWFYADLLKAQSQLHACDPNGLRACWWSARQAKSEFDLAEAHDRLAALEVV
jgi:hypothetical protein